MVVTLKELKVQPGRIVSAAEAGAEVVVTVRGVPAVKIVPFKPPMAKRDFDARAFGMWSDRSDMQDVDAAVRTLRQGREL